MNFVCLFTFLFSVLAAQGGVHCAYQEAMPCEEVKVLEQNLDDCHGHNKTKEKEKGSRSKDCGCNCHFSNYVSVVLDSRFVGDIRIFHKVKPNFVFTSGNVPLEFHFRLIRPPIA